MAAIPEDGEQRSVIEKLASFVARNGPSFEAMTMEKQQNNPLFNFLTSPDAPYHGFYKERLYQEMTAVSSAPALSNYQSKSQPSSANFSYPGGGGMPGSGLPPPMCPPRGVMGMGGPPGQMYGRGPPRPPHMMPPWMMGPRGPGPMFGPGPAMPPRHCPPPLIRPSPNNLLPYSSSSSIPSSNYAPPLPSSAPSVPILPDKEILLKEYEQWKETMFNQKSQSEGNLNAQNIAMEQQCKYDVRAVLDQLVEKKLESLSQAISFNVNELESVVMPILSVCTKENIATGKNWVLQHVSAPSQYFVFILWLVKKSATLSFTQQLHLLYLVNDLLHHGYRKQLPDMLTNLEKVVPCLVARILMCAENAEQLSKVTKLTRLWCENNKFFSDDVTSIIDNGEALLTHFYDNFERNHGHEATESVRAKFTNQLEKLRQQHATYCEHVDKQIVDKRSELDSMLEQVEAAQRVIITSSAPTTQVMQQQAAQPLFAGGPIMQDMHRPLTPLLAPPPQTGPPPTTDATGGIVPTSPYYDLPAGLMLPLVMLSTYDYKPMDPKKLRLPPAAPPTERLLRAMEAYYAATHHDRPRDAEGWERLGLFDFYRQKEAAKKGDIEDRPCSEVAIPPEVDDRQPWPRTFVGGRAPQPPSGTPTVGGAGGTAATGLQLASSRRSAGSDYSSSPSSSSSRSRSNSSDASSRGGPRKRSRRRTRDSRSSRSRSSSPND